MAFRRSVLVKLWTRRGILPRSSSESLDGVRKPGRLLEVRLQGAARCFCCYGSDVFVGAEGRFGLAMNHDDAAWTGHFELTVGIMWHRIESSERGSSEECLVITAEGDDFED